MLKWYLENNYSTIEFKETKHHKPYVLLADGSRPLEYNLSHCEDYIAVAFGSTSQDVDIENIRPLENLESISRQVFTEREIETVFATNELATQTRTFFKFWTCKEAALKANGTGFMKGPKTMKIEMNPPPKGNEPRVCWTEAIQGHSLAWVENPEP